MRLLLDTHILLWAAGRNDKLSESARTQLTAPENKLFFQRGQYLGDYHQIGSRAR